MEQKSLRAMAKELGVSASYLSQVKHGKRPPSEKVLSNSPNLLNELALNGDLKSVRPHSLCGFESRPRQSKSNSPYLLNTEHFLVSRRVRLEAPC